MSKVKSKLARYNICECVMPVAVFPKCAYPIIKPRPICEYKPSGCPIIPSTTNQISQTPQQMITNTPLQIPYYNPELPDPPTGTILTNTIGSVPSGYLLCNGSAVSRVTYDVLFSVIGTTYTTDNNPSVFNLPNLIGENQISYIIKT